MSLGGDGVKTVYVQFMDGAGNVSGSFSDSINLDTTPPMFLFSSLPDKLTTVTNATFSFSASEQVTGFECSLDNGNYVSCVSPIQFSGLSEGAHTFHLRTADLIGNIGVTSYSWTIAVNPVEMRSGGNTTYYGRIGNAFAAVPPSTTTSIRVLALDLNETLTLNAANSVVSLEGGFDSNFTESSGMTTLQGSLTIEEGTLIAGRLSIR
jgi:hypothetical protein